MSSLYSIDRFRSFNVQLCIILSTALDIFSFAFCSSHHSKLFRFLEASLKFWYLRMARKPIRKILQFILENENGHYQCTEVKRRIDEVRIYEAELDYVNCVAV